MSRHMSNVSFNITDTAGDLSLTGLTTSISVSSDNEHRLSGEFTVSSDTTRHAAVQAEIREPFSIKQVIDDSGTFVEQLETGRLVLAASDGSGLVLEADNDNPSMVHIEIRTRDNATDMLSRPWSIWSTSLQFEFVFARSWPSD